ncbi:50S ribosomal protein L25 [Candidatus Annandia adelgestsuga]|uniref:Large ribosomal subunit protein bL25 n=1 Tax=Candidatus Annandia adelgestsuga TaxID=1302411 RepID=A0A3S5HNX6_9ENTR|nr:50S ribosomal protein L25 [Candidatus Annandia adelgestsuga]AZP36332.1 50S ribosomal protein L25 [Candidatus Annandia adelgestsuga]
MLKIKAKKRVKFGKSINKILRFNNKIPAIIYGGNTSKKNIPIEISHDKIIHLYEKKIFYKNILILIDKKKKIVKIKDIQYHPFKNQIIHIDFLIIK